MEDAIPQGIPDPGTRTGHETSVMQTRALIISVTALVGIIATCQVVLALWMRNLNRKDEQAEALYPGRQAIEVEQFPQPRLQESPPVDLVRMLRDERARITSYGWVDQKAGIARIPVDRAMDILAQKGLPRVPAPPLAAGAPPNTSIPPAGKREGAGPSNENSPGPQKTDEPPRSESKQGGKS